MWRLLSRPSVPVLPPSALVGGVVLCGASQPTAAAGAGPDFSCTGELEQPVKPRIGKMCRPSVGASVALSIAWSGLVGLSSPTLVCLGSSAGTGALGFRGSRDKNLGVSDVARVSSSVIGAVRARQLARLLRRVAPHFSRPGLFVGLALAHARCGIAGGSTWLLAITSRACHLGSQCAVRLFWWMGVWGVSRGAFWLA